MRLEELGKLKNPKTTSRIEPAKAQAKPFLYPPLLPPESLRRKVVGFVGWRIVSPQEQRRIQEVLRRTNIV
jgi:hypothetical protein